MKQSYWDHTGTYQSTLAKLEELIPAEGGIENPKKNKALEKFRKACNCYYDLYNNGLCNRAQEFYGIFDIASSNYKLPYGFEERLYELTEDKINVIIIAAAEEQGIELSTQQELF